jgi:hypothetical protein
MATAATHNLLDIKGLAVYVLQSAAWAFGPPIYMKVPAPVIPSIHSLSAAHDRQKLDESGLRNVIDST